MSINMVDKLIILLNNPKDVFEETCRILLLIADNVLKNPANMKVRKLQKTNQLILKKVLEVPGGTECLLLMGFQDVGDAYSLPMSAPLNKLELVKKEIVKLKTMENKVDVNKDDRGARGGAIPKDKPEDHPIENFKKVELPPFKPHFAHHPFLKKIEYRFHRALTYEDPHLRERALCIMPKIQLEYKAQNRLRSYHQHVKKEKLSTPEIDLQDMMILEVLAWFKNYFFKWVDSPDCSSCGNKTRMHGMSDDPELLKYTDRVEMHICDSCKTLTPFPRYNDLNILLETRKGRCGEWANTFTLFCRALGWDTRHIFDETDHVWTEVYSESQKRWLHCDPCENACDTPLIYESGWGKKISYVMAYSAEEVQDVTWRYSSKHREVMARRNKCTEQELLQCIFKLREERQKNLSKSRKDYLKKRILFELLELIVERKPSEKESGGRVSGSLAWRTSRGEFQEGHVWRIKGAKMVTVRYSASSDNYEEALDDEVTNIVAGFQTGVFSSAGILRYVEQDWKMVYLSRREDAPSGSIEWKFEFNDAKLDKIVIHLEHTLFENGTVQATICNKIVCNQLDIAQNKTITLSDFAGSKTITISVKLTGGRGGAAWQHAQLFRQPIDCPQFPLQFKFYLIN